MNFFGFWMLTIVLSYGFRINLYCKIIEDIADKGYILNTKRMKQIKNDISLLKENTIQIPHIIPIVNILSVFNLAQNYFQNKSIVFYRLKNLTCLSLMTNEEFQKYKNNSSMSSIISIMYERTIIEKQKELVMKKLEELREEESKLDELKQEEVKSLQDKQEINSEESFCDKENNLLENETNLEDKPKIKTLKKNDKN